MRGIPMILKLNIRIGIGRSARLVFPYALLLAVMAAGIPAHAFGSAGRVGGNLAAVALSTDLQPPPALGIPLAQPRFSWTLKATKPGSRDLAASAYRILVATSPGALAQGKGDVWDSGTVTGRRMPRVEYRGRALEPATVYYWKVAVRDRGNRWGPWSRTTRFTTALAPSGWSAHWIAASPDGATSAPLPLFRKDLRVRGPLASALVFVSGMGQYQLRVDGRAVTSNVMAPGWTDYRRTVLYNTYDLTAQLKAGKHVLGILLGNGMYDVPDVKGRYTKFTGSFGQPKCIVQLILRYKDGGTETVASDRSWTTHPGPILFSSIYGGEDTDARREPDGWDRAGFKSSGWTPAVEVSGPGGTLQPDLSPPIVVAHVYKPVRVLRPAPGVLVYDLGQNMSGWPAIEVEGARGGTVTLKPGELLDAHGFVTQRSGGGTATEQTLFRYTLRGGGIERWHPLFTYHGFRYVQVEGAATAEHPRAGAPTLLSLNGDFAHAAVKQDGYFHSSSMLLDRIHELITKAILSNTMSILTDCPTREKLGWLEQTYLNGGPLFLNYDMRTLYEKMAGDMRDAQLPDGLVPSIAPEYVQFLDAQGANTAFRDSPEWGSAVILSPWTLYRYSGDPRVLAVTYGSMQRYAAYLAGRAKGHLLDYGLGDWYDIGPKGPGPSQLTSRMLTATATFYEDLTVLARIASILKRPDDAAKYRAEARQVRDAFNKRLFHPETNTYDRGSQTAEAMPLALGMAPAGHEQEVLANLVADIAAHNDHVTAGDVGFHYLVRALTDMHRSDVLAKMMSRTDSPSYGYQLAQGATTLTEAWNANPDDSQNHFMLGHGDEWFYRGLAGIRFDFADMDSTIRLDPAFVPALKSPGATYHSALGDIHSDWQREGGIVRWNVSIPAGATAVVSFRGLRPESVQDAGRKMAEDVHCGTSSGFLTCTLGSGSYTFTGAARN